jgi:hypothetical protein
MVVAGSPASAGPLVGGSFVRTGQAESIVAPLSTFGGAKTAQKWSDLVEVIVSGTGTNNVVTTDAFYFFDPGAATTPTPSTVGFRLSFTGCAAADCGNPPWVLQFLRFSEGMGPVAPPAGNDPTSVIPTRWTTSIISLLILVSHRNS